MLDNTKTLVSALGFSLLAGCAQQNVGVSPPLILTDHWRLQDAAKVDAAAQQISQPGFSTDGWYDAVVPGTVLTTLVASDVYPQPLYGENNRPDKIPESLCRTTYWYRTEFTVPGDLRDRHLWLNLDGINYQADVWVNGSNVGRVNGAFSRGTFDISQFVRKTPTAVLAIRIIPPPNPGDPHEHTQAAGTGPNGGVLARDGPTFLCSIGWDWMPAIRDRNIGIWQKVWLSQTGPVIVENPSITTRLPLRRTDSADLTVSATLRNVTNERRSGILRGTIGEIRFQTAIDLAPQESQLVTLAPDSFPQLRISHPQLWWPNGYGPQNLYTLRLQFDADGAVSDSRDICFGIRQITYHVAGTDNLTISVNGVPIICKGGDWGMDEAMKRIGRDRLEAQIRMHQLANYTMIRNWVGQSTSEDFYDLCDRYGLLVWDEFFQPNPSDGPDPADAALYLANVRDKVLRFRNHPCIALWCARNEGDPPADIDAGIQKIMTELDPLRLYHKNSADGRGVRSGGPYHWRPPGDYYQFPESEAFKTEIGSVSIPTIQAIREMVPEKDWWPPTNDDWAEHDLSRGAQQGDRYPAVLAQRFGPSADLSDFVRKAQLANYEAFRAMYEGRFAKLFHPVSGVITWMSNPAQPSMVWQLYSHDLEPNASMFAVRKACEPVHIQMTQDHFHVMVVNATPTARENLHARVRVLNLDSSLALDHQLEISAAAGAATDAGPIEFPANLSPVSFVKLELFDSANRLISENLYWRTTKMIHSADPSNAFPPEDFTDLQSLSAIKVQVTLKRHDAGGKCLLTARLTNDGKSIALLAHLQLQNASNGRRILPVYYSDNYVSLLPGETREIEIEAAGSTVQRIVPALALDGFNVIPARATSSGGPL